MKMANLETTQETQIDIECGGSDAAHHHHRPCRRLRRSTSDSKEGSCYSQLYHEGPEIGEVSGDSRRASSASDCSVDAAGEGGKAVVVQLGKRDCRICHLNLVEDGDGDAIELGCCCKDDLGSAHKHCAETWFKIKGNKTCEICNSIASNLVGPSEMPPWAEGTADMHAVAASVGTAHVSSAPIRSRGCINGHRLLNFILACMVFAFVISWLFHFNIPS